MSDLPPTPSTPGPSSTPSGETSPVKAAAPAVTPALRQAQRPLRRAPLPTVADGSKRDTIIAIACGGGVLLFLIVGFFMLQGLKTAPVGNKLNGIIVEKYATGVVEQEISVGGKKGLGSEETDSGFYFRVKVPSEQDRVFEMAVSEGQYRAKKVGDPQSFIKPKSEQK